MARAHGTSSDAGAAASHEHRAVTRGACVGSPGPALRPWIQAIQHGACGPNKDRPEPTGEASLRRAVRGPAG
eukprot:10453231-Alexandrium_andersonii.AAC.1